MRPIFLMHKKTCSTLIQVLHVVFFIVIQDLDLDAVIIGVVAEQTVGTERTVAVFAVFAKSVTVCELLLGEVDIVDYD